MESELRKLLVATEDDISGRLFTTAFDQDFEHISIHRSITMLAREIDSSVLIVIDLSNQRCEYSIKTIISHWKDHYRASPIITITPSNEPVIEQILYSHGVLSCISKPIDIHQLRHLIQKCKQRSSLPNQSNPVPLLEYDHPAVHTQIMDSLYSFATVNLVSSDIHIHEEVATYIHNHSLLKNGPFVSIDCKQFNDLDSSGTITFETDNEKSNWTFNSPSNPWKRSSLSSLMADISSSGTLFIKNVEYLQDDFQYLLLDYIGRIKRKHRSIRDLSNRIIISSTEEHTAKLKPRLLAFVNQITIKIPTLNERELPILDIILQRCITLDLPKPNPESLDAIEMIFAQPGLVLSMADLDDLLTQTLCPLSPTTMKVPLSSLKNLNLELKNKYTKDHFYSGSTASEHTSNEIPGNINEALENIEKNWIFKALQKTNGNKTEAADILGLSFRTFRYRCKKLHIDQ